MEGEGLEEGARDDSLVLLAAVAAGLEVEVGAAVLPGELSDRVVPLLAGKVEGVDEAEAPLRLAVGGLVVKVEGVALTVPEPPVEEQVLVLGFKAELVDEAAEVALALHATIEVEAIVVLGDHSMIVVQFEAVVLDAAVECAGAAEGEPELELISGGDLSVLLGERLLECDGGGGGLAGGLEREELLMHVVILEDGHLALLQRSPRLSLEGVCLGHQQNQKIILTTNKNNTHHP